MEQVGNTSDKIDEAINKIDNCVLLSLESLKIFFDIYVSGTHKSTISQPLTEYAKCHVLLLFMNSRIQAFSAEEDKTEFLFELHRFLSIQRKPSRATTTESMELLLLFMRSSRGDKSKAKEDFLYLITLVGLKQQKAIESLRPYSKVAREKKSAFSRLVEEIGSKNDLKELLVFKEKVKDSALHSFNLYGKREETRKKIIANDNSSLEKITPPSSFLSDEQREALLKLLKNKLLEYYLTGAGCEQPIPSDVVEFLKEPRAEREFGVLSFFARQYAASQGVKTSSDRCLHLLDKGQKEQAITWWKLEKKTNDEKIEELLKKETQGLPWNWRAGEDPWREMLRFFTTSADKGVKDNGGAVRVSPSSFPDSSSQL